MCARSGADTPLEDWTIPDYGWISTINRPSPPRCGRYGDEISTHEWGDCLGHVSDKGIDFVEHRLTRSKCRSRSHRWLPMDPEEMKGWVPTSLVRLGGRLGSSNARFLRDRLADEGRGILRSMPLVGPVSSGRWRRPAPIIDAIPPFWWVPGPSRWRRSRRDGRPSPKLPDRKKVICSLMMTGSWMPSKRRVAMPIWTRRSTASDSGACRTRVAE